MRLVMESDKIAMYDETFNDKTFKEIWKYAQNEKYMQPHVSEWIKVWRMTDGSPLGSPAYKYSEKPFNSMLDVVCGQVVEGAKIHKDLVGEWNEIHMRCYLYGRGTRLSWHNDYNYSSACVFYAHPQWASTWGGELMVAEMPKKLPPLPETSSHLDHRWEDAVLEAYGMGSYITAKPNRLVYMSGSTWHAINRVDDDAGDHARCTIVFFFQQVDGLEKKRPTPSMFPNLKPIPIVDA